MSKIKGFKGFDENFKCRDFQYKVGKKYETEEAEACTKGFHLCEVPFDIFNYYPPADSRFAEVEGSGKTDKHDSDSKVACTKIKIGAEIGLSGLITAGVKFIMNKVEWSNNKESNTGYRSAATNTGYRSAATNTGDQSVATNTGDQSVATNTGDQSVATNTGYRSVATNTGDQSVATNTGYRSVATNTGHRSAATNTGDQSAATNTGDQSAATNTGDQSAATNTGHRSAATNTGYCSAATNTGYCSAATVEGKQSIACGLGIKNKAKGKKSCWLVLAEWYRVENEWQIKEVKTVLVDGKKIKEDIFYTLKDGKFVKD